jgi:eukaryotic-like serine/threonine-protein kinase
MTLSTQQEIDDLKRASTLMDVALELDEEKRAAWLTQLNVSDPEIAPKVERLLEAHARVMDAAFLDQTITPESIEFQMHAADAQPSNMVGPYRLIRQIGEGGMSTVWLAERAYPNFVRQVAIKRLPSFLKGPDYERRLLREASILERLNHPHIAQFLDAGISEEGDPYIALELIDGEPITAYCDRLRLDVKSRVALMAVVCDAVAFLHRHSVVHRDIKPSNVFVTKSGAVKLLDFGIAKLIDEAKSQGEITRSAHSAFTPEYAAPEQVSNKPITTATDVYSLGVLLYRMLTGSRPYGRTSPPMLVASAIVNTVPSRPSTLFVRTGEIPGVELDAIADTRQSSVKQMRASLRNDLDNILLKALEKDPVRRYSTVDAFSADLRAYMESRPIQAQQPSMLYILRKFAARHRGSVAASALVALALGTSLAFGAWQARQTQLEAARAKRVLTFLQNLITEASPNNTGVQTITVLELLRQAPAVAKRQFPDDAQLQFEVLKPVEKILRDLDAAEALEPVESEMVKLLPSLASLPPEDAAELLSEYAMTLAYFGKLDEADASVTQAIKRLEDAGKKESAAYAAAMMSRALAMAFRKPLDQAAALAMESHSKLIAHVSKEDPRITKSAFYCIDLLLRAEQLKDATEYVEKFFTPQRIAATPNANDRKQFYILQASFKWYLGDPQTAVAQYDELLKEAKKFFGAGDVTYPKLLHLGGRAAIDNGQYEKAIGMLNEAVAIESKATAPNRRVQVTILSQMALAYLYLGQSNMAGAKLAEASAISQQNPAISVSTYWQMTAQSALHTADYEQALNALEKQATVLSGSVNANVFLLSANKIERANVARLRGNGFDAIELCKTAIAALRARMPEQHYRLARAEVRLAQLLAQNGALEEAHRTIKSAATIIESAVGNTHPLTLQSQFVQGQIEMKFAIAGGESRMQRAAREYESLLKRPIDPQIAALH